jgi:hypothetical protein
LKDVIHGSDAIETLVGFPDEQIHVRSIRRLGQTGSDLVHVGKPWSEGGNATYAQSLKTDLDSHPCAL